MKVVQITDDDAKALLTELELAKWRGPTWFESNEVGISDAERKAITQDAHRWFHHLVTRWLQKHGANVT